MKVGESGYKVTRIDSVGNHLNKNKEKRKRSEEDESYLAWKDELEKVKKEK